MTTPSRSPLQANPSVSTSVLPISSPHVPSPIPLSVGSRAEPMPFSCFSDGAGRTGTYILIDMVLNRMAKGEGLAHSARGPAPGFAQCKPPTPGQPGPPGSDPPLDTP